MKKKLRCILLICFASVLALGNLSEAETWLPPYSVNSTTLTPSEGASGLAVSYLNEIPGYYVTVVFRGAVADQPLDKEAIAADFLGIAKRLSYQHMEFLVYNRGRDGDNIRADGSWFRDMEKVHFAEYAPGNEYWARYGFLRQTYRAELSKLYSVFANDPAAVKLFRDRPLMLYECFIDAPSFQDGGQTCYDNPVPEPAPGTVRVCLDNNDPGYQNRLARAFGNTLAGRCYLRDYVPGLLTVDCHMPAELELVPRKR